MRRMKAEMKTSDVIDETGRAVGWISLYTMWVSNNYIHVAPRWPWRWPLLTCRYMCVVCSILYPMLGRLKSKPIWFFSTGASSKAIS